MTEHIDTVIVGGGQAGLVMSHFMRQQRREHVILERARVGERWRSERWDTLRFQFPNWSLRLPGFSYEGAEPDAFASHQDVTRFIERYAEFIQAPLRCGVEVLAVESDDAKGFRITTRDGNWAANRVVIATGPFQRPKLPPESASLPAHVMQLHASHYHNAGQLPAGAVLVVGTGSSGCQIAEELYRQGRPVYLCVSQHRRAPRRYRERDLMWWLTVLGRFDARIDGCPGGRIPPPLLLTGADGGHDVDLRQFAADGVRLLGRLTRADGGKLLFAGDLERQLNSADESFVEFVKACDDYAAAAGIASAQDPPLSAAASLARRVASEPAPLALDLKAEDVNSVIWCTGYSFDFEWIRLPVFDARGAPLQRRGITSLPNAYFLGLHWMHTMKSGVLFGVAEDADYLAGHIAAWDSRGAEGMRGSPA